MGAMLAMEFVNDRKTKQPLDVAKVLSIVNYANTNGVMMIRCGLYSNGVRFLFPLVITEEQLQEGLDVLEEGIAAVS